MASLFGSMATEFGETVKDLGQQKREERLANEEAQREAQLEKQRMKHDSNLLDKRIAADDARDVRRQEFEKLQSETEFERESTAAGIQHGRDLEITGMQEQSDIIQTIISSELRNRNTRKMSGEGWSVDFEERQSIDPATGQFVYNDVVNAVAPSGRPYRIVGSMAFEAGGSTVPKTQFASPDMRRQAEAPLYSGEISPETFRDIHGYIPADYIFGKVTREEPQIRSIIESTLGEVPAFMMKRRTGRTSVDDRVPSSTPTNSASRELRDIHRRTGRTPTPEETDDVVRRYREGKGKTEYPEGSGPGGTRSPYQGDFGGGGGGVMQEARRLYEQDNFGAGLSEEEISDLLRGIGVGMGSASGAP